MDSLQFYILAEKKNKFSEFAPLHALEGVADLKKAATGSFVFVHRFEDMLNEDVHQIAEKVILDGSLFEEVDFANLSLFWRMYYLNKFKYILSKKREIEGCIHSRLVGEEIFSSVGKRATYFRKAFSYLFFNEHLLVLDREDKNFTINNAALFSRYKKISFMKYDKFIFFSKKRLGDFLKNRGIDRTIFVLPYRNIIKKTLLSKFEKISAPYYVFERGALPGCFIFDDKGFNFDSRSYNREFWDSDYSESEKEFTSVEVQKVLEGSSLEDQAGEEETLKMKKEILMMANGREIIFVPLQRPWDSVIRYFNPLGYRAFVKEILNFSAKYKDEYFIVLKKHPQEKKWPFGLSKISAENIFLINQTAHINDILSLSKAVVLINSGVGVLSLIFKKPVFYFGKVFYEIPGCNASFSSAKELKEKLDEEANWNQELAVKFLNYLYNRYYSLNEKLYTSYSVDDWVYKYTKIRLPGLSE